MRIAYNPSTEPLASAPLNNDITIDLAGKTIYARGVKVGGASYGVFLKHTSISGGGYDGLVPAPPYVTTTTTRYLTDTGEWKTINFVDTYNKTEIDDLISGAKTYTDTKIANLVNGAPETLDTLKEISDYLQDSTVVGGLLDLFKKYLPLSGGVMKTSSGIYNESDQNGYGAIGFNFDHNAFGSLTFPTKLRSSSADVLLHVGLANTQYTLIHTGNIGSQSVLTSKKLGSFFGNIIDGDLSNRPVSADLNYTDKSLRYYLATASMTTGRPDCDGFILHCAWDNTAYNGQLFLPNNFNSTASVKYRVSDKDAKWDIWRTILDNVNLGNYISDGLSFTSNLLSVTSAPKLSIARTIWGQSFDGSGNVSGNISEVGTINKYFNFQAGTSGAAVLHAENIYATVDYIHMYVSNLDKSRKDRPLVLQNGYGNVGIGTTSPQYKLDVAGGVRSRGVFLHNKDGNDNWYYTKINTEYEQDSPNYLNGAMVFYTMHNTYEAGTEVERMRITSDGKLGVGTTSPQYKLHVNGHVFASGFVKSDSSDSYLLLGGGGHKAISDFMLKSDELTNNLTTITKTLTVTKDWMDTGIKYTDLTTGTYAVQVYSYATNNLIWDGYWSGVMTWYGKGTNSSESDEILLHRGAHAYNGNTIYLRTINTVSSDGRHMRLQIAANKNFSSATYTFKFKKLI